jgi:hypothetical protein
MSEILFDPPGSTPIAGDYARLSCRSTAAKQGCSLPGRSAKSRRDRRGHELLEFDPSAETAMISPLGVAYVEDEIIRPRVAALT